MTKKNNIGFLEPSEKEKKRLEKTIITTKKKSSLLTRPEFDKKSEDQIYNCKSPLLFEGISITGEENVQYKTTIIMVVFIAIQLIFNIFFTVQFIQDSSTFTGAAIPFVLQNIMAILFTIVGVFNHNIWTRKASLFVVKAPDYRDFLWGGVAAGIIIVVQFIGGVLFSLSVSPIQWLLFFISIAIAEEALWRYGFQSTFKIILMSWFSHRVAQIIAVTTASFLFAFSHVFLFSTLEDFWLKLSMTFIIGVILGAFYEWRKDISATILAHVINNLVAGIRTVIEVFGGF